MRYDIQILITPLVSSNSSSARRSSPRPQYQPETQNVYGSFFTVYFSTPINKNGNISSEGILNHRKYRCDYIVSFCIYREP